ncbi:hypothetical protein EE612_038129 [Oryza sativa]|nr:hypothetical protein EE612_038129 [Oryza sativa]
MAIEMGKRKRPVDDGGDSSEPELPADIITHITGRLTSQVDFLNCRNVCPSWERALRGEARRLAAAVERVPWLLLAAKADGSYLGRRQAGDVAAVQLPGRHVRLGRREICLGCSSGWLVVANDFGYARLVNPLTAATAPLPPLWRLPYLDAAHGYDGCVGSFLYVDEHHRGGPGVAFSFDGLCDLVLLKAVVVDISDGGATVAVLYRRERSSPWHARASARGVSSTTSWTESSTWRGTGTASSTRCTSPARSRAGSSTATSAGRRRFSSRCWSSTRPTTTSSRRTTTSTPSPCPGNTNTTTATAPASAATSSERRAARSTSSSGCTSTSRSAATAAAEAGRSAPRRRSTSGT